MYQENTTVEEMYNDVRTKIKLDETRGKKKIKISN